jgi:Rieske Fe-S protein
MASLPFPVSRRKFLRATLAVSSGLMAGNLVSGRTFAAAMAGVAPLHDTFGGDSVTLNLEEYEELKQDGGFRVIKEVNIGETTDNLIIVRKSEKEYLVFSSVCRHKKCNVKYKDERKLFVCPCHGSNYDLTGKVVKGPSTANIPQYDAILSGTKLIISSKS